jgi:hypothetical protein
LTNRFKVGDKVQVWDGCDTALPVGKVYTVSAVEGNMVGLKEQKHKNGQWLADRFTLFNPVPNMPEVSTKPLFAVDQGYANNSVDPDHYTRFAIQPITFITKNKLEFWQGNIIKDIMRYDAKDGLKDLRKARRYLDEKIAELEGTL